MSSFDYGDKKPDGQHERHPTNTKGEFVAPIRTTYVHGKCGVATTVSMGIAETYAKNPKFYGSTFCSGCQDYFPVSEFKWDYDNVTVGEIGPSKKERRTKQLLAERAYYQEETKRIQETLARIEDEISKIEGKEV